MRRCLLLLALIACTSKEPPLEVPPDRFVKIEAPAPQAAPPPPAPAPAPVEEAAPAAKASAERKARVAEAVQKQGVLKIIGAQGSGGVSDVLGSGGASGDVGDALSGASGVGISQGGRGGGSGSAGIGNAAQPEWPTLQGIPVPTTRKFLGAPAQKTLGDVVKWITGALEQHDYEEMGFFRYQDGFAIATRPERIDPEARPILSKRWPQARVHKADEAKSVQALFEVNGDEGDRYRAFVFLCIGGSDVDQQGGAEQTWGLWKTGSMNPEGDALLAQPVTAQKLYAYVYELSQAKDGRVLVAAASVNTAIQHLRGAGLGAFLR